MDTTKQASLAEEVADAASAASLAGSASQENKPYAISEAREVAKDVQSKWERARRPEQHEWVSFGMTLSTVGRALSAMHGLAQLNDDHEFARYSSEEYEAPLHSITGYQASCVREAQQLLAWMAHNELDTLCERYCRE